MDATVDAHPADEHAIIRLVNGATIDSRDGVHKTWAPGGHLIYEGVSISRALAHGVEVKPRMCGAKHPDHSTLVCGRPTGHHGQHQTWDEGPVSWLAKAP